MLVHVTHYDNATKSFTNGFITPEPILCRTSFHQVPENVIHTVAYTEEQSLSNLGPVQIRMDIEKFLVCKNWNIYYLCNLDFFQHMAVKMLATTTEYYDLCPYDYTIHGGPWYFDGKRHYLAPTLNSFVGQPKRVEFELLIEDKLSTAVIQEMVFVKHKRCLRFKNQCRDKFLDDSAIKQEQLKATQAMHIDQMTRSLFQRIINNSYCDVSVRQGN